MAWSSSTRRGPVVVPHRGDSVGRMWSDHHATILSPSLSIEAFEELGQIRRAPVHVTIFIQPELRNLTFQLEQGPAIYQVPVG